MRELLENYLYGIGQQELRKLDTVMSALIETYGTKSLSQVLDVLREGKTVDSRSFAAIELSTSLERSSRQVLEALEAAVTHDPDPRVRRSAAWAIGHHLGPDSSSVGVLVSAFERESEVGVKQALLVAVARSNDSQALPFIERVLVESKAADLRRAAASALTWVPGRASISVVDRALAAERSPGVILALRKALREIARDKR